jgi:hypothetical protein
MLSREWGRPTTTDRLLALRHLRELIEALDQRVPQIGRAGEAAIALDAAALRARALERIAELEREPGRLESAP